MSRKKIIHSFKSGMLVVKEKLRDMLWKGREAWTPESPVAFGKSLFNEDNVLVAISGWQADVTYLLDTSKRRAKNTKKFSERQ